MADRIGVQRRWLQDAGEHTEHFDIALSRRELAVKAGAVGVSQWDLGRRLVRIVEGHAPGCFGKGDEPEECRLGEACLC